MTIDQWDALVAVSSGAPPATFPRTEVVIDLNVWGDIGGQPHGTEIVALRLGNFKLIYGAVGETTVIPDNDYKCNCCELRRPPLPKSGGHADQCASASVLHESKDEIGYWDSAKRGPTPVYKCTRASPCLFDVVTIPLPLIS